LYLYSVFLQKVEILLPGNLGKIVKPFKHLFPKNFVIPFFFGDFKLFICKKE